MMEGSILWIADVTKPFEVETNAFDFALGSVLLQDNHPIACEGRKLNDAKRKYAAFEKKMLAAFHCLQT